MYIFYIHIYTLYLLHIPDKLPTFCLRRHRQGTAKKAAVPRKKGGSPTALARRSDGAMVVTSDLSRGWDNYGSLGYMKYTHDTRVYIYIYIMYINTHLYVYIYIHICMIIYVYTYNLQFS